MSCGNQALAEAMPIWREIVRRTQHTFVWVYAIRAGDDGPVKIGVTRAPAKRLAQLQRTNHEQLHGLAAWRDFPAVEKQLHAEFAHARIGGEWFQPVPELLALVEQLGGGFEDWTA